MTSENVFNTLYICPYLFVHGISHAGDASTVRGALYGTIPESCQAFIVGNVAFMISSRGVGSGYKTHKRLGAELKGAHILRWGILFGCALWFQVLEGGILGF